MSKLYSFPDEFLRKSAINHGLSDSEAEVFHLRFGDGLDTSEIRTQCSLSKDGLNKRFSEIYRKYELIGKAKGKEHELLKTLDQEFDIFRDNRRRDEEISDLGRERENASLQQQLDNLWELYNQLVRDSDSSSFKSPDPTLSQNVGSFIDIYIEKLENTNQPTQEILKGFCSKAPIMIEELAINSNLKEREIAIKILKIVKSFGDEIINNNGSKIESAKDLPIDVFPSVEETMDSK